MPARSLERGRAFSKSLTSVLIKGRSGKNFANDMYLYIDTTESDSFMVGFVIDKKIVKKTVKSNRQHSEKLLRSIKKMLSSPGKELKDLKAIFVVRGPGSFTSLRIGIATANALGYGLDVPVVPLDKGVKISKIKISRVFKNRIVLPQYDQRPMLGK